MAAHMPWMPDEMICACPPCAGAMLIFSASFQIQRMIPEGNPEYRMKRWNAANSRSENRHQQTWVEESEGFPLSGENASLKNMNLLW